MHIVYAESPQQALEEYREKHPEDKRHYYYTGAYRRFVVSDLKNTWED